MYKNKKTKTFFFYGKLSVSFSHLISYFCLFQIVPDKVQLISKYFSDLTPEQLRRFGLLQQLYNDWNAKINVISRKDINHLYERHVLHSLGIARIIQFKEGTRVMDAGTGGGFPGIPLAIYFPDVQFMLVDSIGKKIKVVNAVIEELGLKNAIARQARMEEINEKFDFVVSRAVASLPEFYKTVGGKIKSRGFNELANGILYLKGGEIEKEILPMAKQVTIYELHQYFEEEYFETKKLVHISKTAT